MKLKNLILLAVGLCLIPRPAPAEAYDPQFSLSLDLTGSEAFVPGVMDSSATGLGGVFFADWRPAPVLSLGVGMDYTSYLVTPGWRTGSLFLGGRLFPAPADETGELYLQGGVGLNLSSTVGGLKGKWPGNGHASAGAGYRFFVNPGNALDLGFQYDFFTPLADPLSAVVAKVGWTWLFGAIPTDLEKPAAKPQPKATPAPPKTSVTATPSTPKPKPAHKPARKKKKGKKSKPVPVETPTPNPNAPVTYVWVAGDTLETISEAFLGRGNLFPLIVDANKAALGSPAGLQPGVPLIIPQNVSDAVKDAARARSDSPEYSDWKKVGRKY